MPGSGTPVVAVDAPELEGDRVRFVALPDGALVVEEGATDVWEVDSDPL